MFKLARLAIADNLDPIALIDVSCRDRNQLLYNNRILPVIKRLEAQ
ncbi:hypothetical protein [Microcoleus sp. A003_D6]